MHQPLSISSIPQWGSPFSPQSGTAAKGRHPCEIIPVMQARYTHRPRPTFSSKTWNSRRSSAFGSRRTLLSRLSRICCFNSRADLMAVGSRSWNLCAYRAAGKGLCPLKLQMGLAVQLCVRVADMRAHRQPGRCKCNGLPLAVCKQALSEGCWAHRALRVASRRCDAASPAGIHVQPADSKRRPPLAGKADESQQQARCTA